MNPEKTPQNINDLVSGIGERMILFSLVFTDLSQKALEIFKNYSEPGFDIGVRNTKARRKMKIEVKTVSNNSKKLNQSVFPRALPDSLSTGRLSAALMQYERQILAL